MPAKNIEHRIIGKATDRIDGPLKVTGQAKYTSDRHLPWMLYAVPVGATIANGTIKSIDDREARALPGVQGIYHRGNIGQIYRVPPDKGFDFKTDEARPPFEDDTVRYYGQFVAVAVAETLEAATDAASRVRVHYEAQAPNVKGQFFAENPKLKVESERGNAAETFANAAAEHKIEHIYSNPAEFHSAIELHGTVADYDGRQLTVYETTQAIGTHRNVIAAMLGLDAQNVKVISKFLGSGFGGKLWPWSHSVLACVLARDLGRPIKLVNTRKAVFHTSGHRPEIEQRIRLSATPQGRLTSIQHDYINHASMLDKYVETCGEATKYFYSCPNVKISSAVAKRNVGSPTSMRGPGAVPGLFATESALDELAIKLGIDPVQLRIINEPQKDEGLDIPFASRHLLECYKTGAQKFGWDKRNPKVGSMRDKDGLILGWGTAGAGWIAERIPAQASVQLGHDGSIKVLCGTQDIGTGTYTVLAQIAAEELKVPLDRIEVQLGDTGLPPGPLSGGSMVTGSVIPAVQQAAQMAASLVLSAAATAPNSPYNGVDEKELDFSNGMVHRKSEDAKAGVPFDQLLKTCKYKLITGKGQSAGTFGGGKPKESRHSYGAHFVQVTWQPETARLRINRVVTVIDAGKILNPKAGRNQIEGSIVMGMGMALFEGGRYEPKLGAPINSNFADYVMPVHLDVPELDVTFLEFANTDLNAYGARGIGEIGLAGFAAATCNAVYHATGVRVRDLPIRIEDLLASQV